MKSLCWDEPEDLQPTNFTPLSSLDLQPNIVHHSLSELLRSHSISIIFCNKQTFTLHRITYQTPISSTFNHTHHLDVNVHFIVVQSFIMPPSRLKQFIMFWACWTHGASLKIRVPCVHLGMSLCIGSCPFSLLRAFTIVVRVPSNYP